MTDSDYLLCIWARVYAFVRAREPRLPALTLRVGCPALDRERRTSPRAFCHVGGHGRRITEVCCHPILARLPLAYILGLLLHEIGHVIALLLYRSSEQWEADASLHRYGIRLSYRGRYLVEHVDRRTLRRVLRGAA